MKQWNNAQDLSAASPRVNELTGAEWLACEQTIRRFEEAWHSGYPPAIEDFLPAADQQRAAVLPELIYIDFELSHKRGENRTIESYLERFPVLRANRSALRDLVAAEIARRMVVEPGFNVNEYASRFPELAGELSSLSVGGGNTVRRRVQDRQLPGEQATSGPLPELLGFEILSELGRGGMGIVYLARQTKLKRLVAVKMIRSHGVTEAGELARFETEIETAARLKHPHIVQIYEVGKHNGQPYCVLEYIAGGSLQEALRGTPQPPNVAAGLVRQLALAVQHAHEQGIVHRDLKPANILLEGPGSRVESRGPENSGSGLSTLDPRLKIADFGLARQFAGVDEGQTQTGTIIGTPAYMSPEQAAGNSKDCGPATDIYSLGVILYELLTGRPPHQGATVLDTLEQVRSQDPIAPRSLQPKTPRDLNTICLKCLQKDVVRRYVNAQALADDLLACLEGRPITARAVGLPERTWLAARRRPLVATLAATVCLVTAIGLSVAAYQWRQTSAALKATVEALKNEQTERGAKEVALDNAKQSLADTQAFSQFVTEDVLAVARPEGLKGGLGIDVTVREALDHASENLANRFAGQPRAEAIARLDLGETYSTIGELARAEVHFQAAVRLRRQLLGLDHVATMDAENRLGTVLRQQGKTSEGLALHESLRARCERQTGANSPETLAILYSLAYDYKAAGRSDDALRLSEQLLTQSRTAFGSDHASTLKAMRQQSGLLWDEGRLTEAMALAKESFEIRLQTLGPGHPHTLSSLSNLALIYKKQGQADQALALLEQHHALTQTKLGLEHPTTLISMTNVAQMYGEQGRLREAVDMDEKAQRIATSKFGDSDLTTLELSRQLAKTYDRAGREADSLPIYKQTYERRQTVLGTDHPDTLVSQGELALAYKRAGRREEAIALAEQTLKSIRDKHGDTHPKTIWAMNGLALSYKSGGRASEALPLYEHVVKGLAARHGPDHRDTLTARNNLGGAYYALGRTDEAIQIAEETLALSEKKLGPQDPSTLIVVHNLASNYQKAERHDDAHAFFRRAYEGRAATLGADHSDTLESMYRYAMILSLRKEMPQAEQLLRECQQRLASSKNAPAALTKSVAAALEEISARVNEE